MLLLCSLAFSACEKFLDVEPLDSVSDESTIFDKTSAETAVRGAYRGLASLNYSGGFQNTILQSGADVVSVNVGLTDLSVTNYDLRADIPFLQTYWNNNYNTINRANHIIEKVPLVDDVKLTPALRDQFVGEALFIRALSYFDLVRLYGGVQIFLTPTRTVEDKIGVPRSTTQQTYDQILTDLNLAESLLPATVVRNRATKFTVQALRARVNLYLKRYEAAESDASAVLTNDAYRLIRPFALAAGTTESVLELSYSINNINPGFVLWSGNRQLSPTVVLHDLLNDPTVGGGRKILSVKTGANYFGKIFPVNTSSNYVLRTAELYLIRAEARALKQAPDLVGALADLNAVRERSDLLPILAATPAELLLAVENERRVEFALEPLRWFDLVRTGRAPAVLQLQNPDKYIFPIPANEIATNPVLTQNPGY